MNFLGILIAALLVQVQSAAIEGIVLRSGTMQPIANAVVELSGSNKSQGGIVVATETDGRFAFRNLAPGRYSLTVSRNGYLDSAYGQRGPNGKSSVLSIESGQTLKEIRLTMVATGAISGRVSDGRGEPLANVSVQALKYSFQDGERKLAAVKTESTNDRGEYRLFWLPPGTYYISAAAPLGPGDGLIMAPNEGHQAIRISAGGLLTIGDRPAAEKLGEADAPVYYPGSADSQAAAPVDLRPGADIGGIDFSLTRVKTRSIRGIVIDSVSGRPTSTNMLLIPRQFSVIGGSRAGVASDGSFEFRNVLPGSYYIVADKRRIEGKASDVVMGARVPIEVGGSDIERVAVTLTPGLNISGEITVEGRSGTSTDNSHPVVTMRNKYPGMPAFAQLYGSFKDNSQFTVDDVLEGEYRVVVEDLPKGAYVKSIRYGAIDALNNSLLRDARSSDRLHIVISMDGSKLDGIVVNKSRDVLGNGAVTLVPDAAHRDRADLYRKATTDESGRFHFEAVAPGEYSLFAWEDIDDNQWRDPEFIRRNEALGKPVHIVEAGNENVELTAIPVEF